jgi:hypothetical protein
LILVVVLAVFRRRVIRLRGPQGRSTKTKVRLQCCHVVSGTAGSGSSTLNNIESFRSRGELFGEPRRLRVDLVPQRRLLRVRASPVAAVHPGRHARAPQTRPERIRRSHPRGEGPAAAVHPRGNEEVPHQPQETSRRRHLRTDRSRPSPPAPVHPIRDAQKQKSDVGGSVGVARLRRIDRVGAVALAAVHRGRHAQESQREEAPVDAAAEGGKGGAHLLHSLPQKQPEQGGVEAQDEEEDQGEGAGQGESRDFVRDGADFRPEEGRRGEVAPGVDLKVGRAGAKRWLSGSKLAIFVFILSNLQKRNRGAVLEK